MSGTGVAPRISVVVPVFNAAGLIRASVLSVLHHTATTVEVICVDDGSSDGTSGVLQALASEDARVKVVTLAQNQGETPARNAGIDRAVGDFVFCLDADDTVPPGALDALLRAAEMTDCELVVGKLLWLRRAEEALEAFPSPGSGLVSIESVQSSPFLQSVPGCHCCNLYSRRLLDRHAIRYETDLTFGGDQLFQATAIVNAGQVAVLDQIVYVYHHYRGWSVTRKPPSLRNLLDDIRFHRRIGILYLARQLPEAGIRFLSFWSYAIKEYWLRMPESLTPEESTVFFDAFRELVAEFDLKPWNARTPAEHRAILESILAGRDEEALQSLRQMAIAELENASSTPKEP